MFVLQVEGRTSTELHMSEKDLVLKSEPEWDVPVAGVVKTSDLYNHEVKIEIVSYPDAVKPPDEAFADCDVIKSKTANNDRDEGCTSCTKENSSPLRTMDLYNTIHEDCNTKFHKYTEINKEDDNVGSLNEKPDVTNLNLPNDDETYSPNANNLAIDNKRKVISDDENDSCDADERRISYIEDEVEIPPAHPKKGRKRKHQEHTLAQAKQRKYANLPYHGKKKFSESKKFSNYQCSCNRLCFSEVSKEIRQSEFDKFYTLGSYEAQLLYILNCVTQTTKKRTYATKTERHRPRQYSRKYTIAGITVCRDMFVNNFQISTKKIDVALKKKLSGQLQDQRGQASGGWNKKVTPVQLCEASYQ